MYCKNLNNYQHYAPFNLAKVPGTSNMPQDDIAHCLGLYLTPIGGLVVSIRWYLGYLYKR